MPIHTIIVGKRGNCSTINVQRHVSLIADADEAGSNDMAKGKSQLKTKLVLSIPRRNYEKTRGKDIAGRSEKIEGRETRRRTSGSCGVE